MSGTWGMIGGTLVGQGGSAEVEPYGVVSVASGVSVAAHATPHTKGAWVELIASTAADGTLIELVILGLAAPATATGTLLDVALGGAGAEVAIVSNVPIGSWSEAILPLPVAVPAGSRVSVRTQSVVSGKTCTVTATVLAGGAITPPASLTVIGASTGTSRGTAVSTSTWTEITAATAAAYQHLIIVPSASDAVMSSSSARTYLATGGSGSEVESTSIRTRTNTSEQLFTECGGVGFLAPGVASGTRLTARHAEFAIDVAVIGVP